MGSWGCDVIDIVIFVIYDLDTTRMSIFSQIRRPLIFAGGLGSRPSPAGSEGGDVIGTGFARWGGFVVVATIFLDLVTLLLTSRLATVVGCQTGVILARFPTTPSCSYKVSEFTQRHVSNPDMLAI